MQNFKMTKRSASLWRLSELGGLNSMHFVKQLAMDKMTDKLLATAPAVSAKDAQGKSFSAAELFV